MADNLNDKNLNETKKILEGIHDLTKRTRTEEEEWYRLQKDINSGLEGYKKNIDEIIGLTSDLKTIQKQKNELLEKQNQISKKLSKEELETNKRQIAFLDEQYAKINKELVLRKQLNKEAKKFSMLTGEALAGTINSMSKLNKIPNFITGKLGILKGLFEMDKAIRTTVTQMGVLGKQGDIVRQNIKAAAVNTISFGVGIKEVAEIQAQYTESLGRNVMLSEKSLETIAEIGKSTGIGLEGATDMAMQFDKMGSSVQMTGKFIQETLDESKSLGLNATKVMKNISQNIKMLNKYRFKDGIKGLVKMAELATKLGVDMEFASGMSDKLWNVEGAVEMSAQLQVMGGAWAQLADPFKLMYQARNDMAGLTENIANAAASSMSFAKDGSIETNAMEMHKLKIIAEQTGLEYDKLVEVGKTAFKLSKIKMQSGGLPSDLQDFLANTAEFKDGKAYVELKAGPKLVSFLSEQDISELKKMQNEKKSMEERAKEAQSFNEKFQNLINMVEITMMPIVEGLTEALDPLVKDLMKGKFQEDLKSLGKNIGEFVKWGAENVGWLVKNIVDVFGAKGLFYTYLFGNVAKWVINGYALSKGFLAGAGAGGFGAGSGGTTAGGPAGGYTKNGMPINKAPAMSTGAKLMGKNVLGGKLAMGTMGSMAAGAGLGIAGYGTDKLRESIYGEGSKDGKGLGVASAALKGAGMGMMFGPWGAAIGGLIGGGYGIYDEYFNEEQNDAKFPSLGTSHSKKRAIVQGGKITPIDNKDDVLAMKPGGIVDKTLNNTKAGKIENTKIEFGELVISGEIKVNLPGGTQIGTELMKSQEFKTAITRVVTSQLEKNINGGKNKG
jgi:hypothetical protein